MKKKNSTVSKQQTRESKMLSCTGFILTEIVVKYCPQNDFGWKVKRGRHHENSQIRTYLFVTEKVNKFL